MENLQLLAIDNQNDCESESLEIPNGRFKLC